MKTLRINTVGGLYDELYDPSPLSPIQQKDFFDLNNLFWIHTFSESNLHKCLSSISLDANRQLQNDIKAYAALSYIDNFIERVKTVSIRVCDQSQSQSEFFSDLETLSIACHLISQTTTPFVLSVNEGFLRSRFSSEEMSDNCLSPYSNPYYTFIAEQSFPIVKKYDPDIVFFMGRPNIASFALAMLIRAWKPSAYLCISNHSSEYFSLNKIDKYLSNNIPLFRVFDCVTLDDTNDTVRSIVDCISSGQSFKTVPGILYTEHTPDQIAILKTKRTISHHEITNITFRHTNEDEHWRLSPNTIANVKLFPTKACYWNKCTFCGINSKYMQGEGKWDIANAIRQIDIIAEAGCKFFWAIDEAIPPLVLAELAHSILDKELSLVWQARSRIDSDFIKADAFHLLAKAGLKEIRLGLESASDRILNLMQKTDNDHFLDLAESIVSRFNDEGVCVHFPTIIGFPTETKFERRQTFLFLETLRKKYSNFSYNINVFDLDVSSVVYKHWEEYCITQIRYPCNPSNFLGNSVEWDSVAFPVVLSILRQEQDGAMRKQYSWYPENALTKPYIFYRLWETSRKSLTSHYLSQKEAAIACIDSSKKYVLSPNVCILDNVGEQRYSIVYNWNNHHVIYGGKSLTRVARLFTVSRGINEIYLELNVSKGHHKGIQQLIGDMIRFDFVKEVAPNESTGC